MADIERTIQSQHRDRENDIENFKNLVNLNINKKVDYRDLDQLAASIHSKVDHSKVSDLVEALRNELIAYMQQVKKEVTGKKKQK